MQTFSVGLQSVTVDGHVIALTVGDDYSICCLTVDDKQVATFNRNGLMTSVEDVPPPPPPADETKSPPPATMATSSAKPSNDEPKGGKK